MSRAVIVATLVFAVWVLIVVSAVAAGVIPS
jgi:hypothetical protein